MGKKKTIESCSECKEECALKLIAYANNRVSIEQPFIHPNCPLPDDTSSIKPLEWEDDIINDLSTAKISIADINIWVNNDGNFIGNINGNMFELKADTRDEAKAELQEILEGFIKNLLKTEKTNLWEK